jgi:type IV fimbrial biogenesis protein FimT
MMLMMSLIHYMQLWKGLPLLAWTKKNLGINFFEVLIVMAIIVILTVIAIPSFITFTQKQRLISTTNNLFAALQLARSEAMKRNTAVFVSFQTGDNWCYGVNTGSNCTCSTPSSCNLGTMSAAQSQQNTLSTTGLSSNAFQFEASRGATNISSGVITMTVYGQATSISLLISQLGTIQLCSSLGGYQACP